MTTAFYRLKVGDSLLCEGCGSMVGVGGVVCLELKQEKVPGEPGNRYLRVEKVICQKCYEKEQSNAKAK